MSTATRAVTVRLVAAERIAARCALRSRIAGIRHKTPLERNVGVIALPDSDAPVEPPPTSSGLDRLAFADAAGGEAWDGNDPKPPVSGDGGKFRAG